MNWLEALILGLIQGLTEFLPVSSSGHLAIAGTFFGLEGEENLAFAVLLHIATVLSTMVVFRHKIGALITGLFSSGMNEEKQMIGKLLISAIPVAIVGLFFKDTVESFFGTGLAFVGMMLCITAVFLMIAELLKKSRLNPEKEISVRDAFLIGIAQALAVIPGISRSGATISTGLMLKNDRSKSAEFAFLMVLIPVLGEAFLEIVEFAKAEESSTFLAIPVGVMVSGFLAAFVSGFLACKWMIALINKQKLFIFVIYCFSIGSFLILYTVFRGF